MKIIHTVSSLGKNAGGTTQAVTALCSELGRLGLQVDLIAHSADAVTGDYTVLPSLDLVATYFASARRFPNVSRFRSHSFAELLQYRIKLGQTKVIHDHGTWLPSNHATAVIARRLGIPRIVTTHGMLEPWSLSQRAWKKRMAWGLYQHHDLQTASVIHATAQQEADNLRRLGLRSPIAVIPNGVELAPWADELARQGDIRTALFLSRIHPKKGLLELVDAWRVVRPEGWHVIVAGPDEDGHRAVVEERIRRYALSNQFTFLGPIDGVEKTALYRKSDLFILPTFSENFGVVIAEALVSGLPVITTKGAPWEGLETHRCGWWIDVGVDPLIAAIREATSMPEDCLEGMRERAKAFARAFAWQPIAEQVRDVYQWMIHDVEAPDCICLD